MEITAEGDVTIERLYSGQAELLTTAIRDAYGDSYDHTWAYDSEAIAARLDNETLVSFIACAPDGKIVGHIGLMRESRDDKVGESGVAVVHPDWRNHHLFAALKRRLMQWCSETGVYGMYSEATAAHPYSQAANLKIGATESGFLLGYIPAEVNYVDIEKKGNRPSVALLWIATSDIPHRVVYAPEWHREILTKLYDHNSLSRKIGEGEKPVTGTTTLLATERIDDHSDAFITVLRQGSDLLTALEREMSALKSEGNNAIYVDFELSDPATGVLPVEMHDNLGLFFGGIVPEVKNGDVLRFQHLHNADVQIDDIVTASDFGKDLLDYIFKRKYLASNQGSD